MLLYSSICPDEYTVMKVFLISIVALLTLNVKAQEEKKIVKNTFRGGRVLNGESVETPSKDNLNFIIVHKFSDLSQGFYDFFGLDEAEIRLGFDYGITENLSAGIGRSGYQKTYDLYSKYKFLEQEENGLPLSATLHAGAFFNTLRNIMPTNFDTFSGRSSYMGQLILARKMGHKLSVQATAGLLYEGYSFSEFDANYSMFSTISTRFRLTRIIYIAGEYSYITGISEVQEYPYAIGFNLDTGGHLFQLIFSNSQATHSKSMLTDTFDSWTEGSVYFGFNLVRTFYL